MTYRMIDTKIWSDSGFIELSGEARYAYLYLLTTSHGNLAGCFECSAACIARDTDMTREKAASALAEIRDAGMIDVDENTNEVLILKWGEHQWSKSDRLLKALAKSIAEIASARLKKQAASIYETFGQIPYPYPIDTLSEDTLLIPYAYPIDRVSGEFSTEESPGQIPYPYPIDTLSGSGTGSGLNLIPESVDSPNPLQPERARADGVSPRPTPSLEEVIAYGKRAGIVVDCEAFFDVNEKRGWMLEGEPIRDWKALLKSWAEAERRRVRDTRRAAEGIPVGKTPYKPCPKCGGPMASYGDKAECVTCHAVFDNKSWEVLAS